MHVLANNWLSIKTHSEHETQIRTQHINDPHSTHHTAQTYKQTTHDTKMISENFQYSFKFKSLQAPGQYAANCEWQANNDCNFIIHKTV